MTAFGGEGRSTATVLFTDLVASTERWSRVGEPAADVLRRLHDRLLAEAVQLHQGRVIKGLGDGIMAAFAGAADAVDGAVAIQRSFDRHNRAATGDSRFDARIGISSGDVSFEAGDCFGAPVTEAARLCQAANGGQILVGHVVRLLVGSQAGYRFSAVGSLDLKGLPGPVDASEVDWTPEVGVSIPLPAGIEGAAAPRFVGRRTELDRLAEAWAKSLAGGRAAVLVGGNRASARAASWRKPPAPSTRRGRSCSTGGAKRSRASRTSASPRRWATTSPRVRRPSCGRSWGLWARS